MDYAGYQRQPTPGHPGSHMATMGSLGMPAVPFTHSWMVPTQDLCAMPPYNKMTGHQQPPGAGMHAQQQPLEPGLVVHKLAKTLKFCSKNKKGRPAVLHNFFYICIMRNVLETLTTFKIITI